jgi:hypothetical protein
MHRFFWLQDKYSTISIKILLDWSAASRYLEFERLTARDNVMTAAKAGCRTEEKQELALQPGIRLSLFSAPASGRCTSH